MNDEQRLRKIFERTDGHCHLTGRQLVFKNYGRFGERGAWEIEHSVARVNGGTDHLNNLYPAEISANRAKQDLHTRTVRAQHGLSRAPLSADRKTEVRETNQWKGLALGAFFGLFFGPIGVGIGAAIGAIVGGEQEVR